MIKINDTFDLNYDGRCWHLIEWRDGINAKTKEPIRSKTTTYHTSLLCCATAIIDKSAGKACRNGGNIVEAIRAAKNDMLLTIRGGGLKRPCPKKVD